MKGKSMLMYDEALRVALEAVRPLPAVTLELTEALGQVLAEPASALWDLPPADNSAMDGYAFACAGREEGAILEVVGFVPAGAPFTGRVGTGQAVKIMTGAPLPGGCDTVAPVEEVEEQGGRIRLGRRPERGRHVRIRGEEMRQGEVLLKSGTPLYSGEMGLLAAAGIATVCVHPRPRVAILSTGDELVELGEVPGPGQIVNSNFHLLAARLREDGCRLISLGIARDEEADLDVKLAAGLQADLLITTGGVSVGERDYVQSILERHGFRLGFWRVGIKPGKPVIFGTASGTPVLGLPGNPAASAATFELFARPLLRRLAGHGDPLPPRLRVTLTDAVSGGEKRQRFLWGALREQEGRYRFTPSTRQGSGQNRSIQGSRALLPVPGDSPGLPAGSEVEVLLLRLPPGGPEHRNDVY